MLMKKHTPLSQQDIALFRESVGPVKPLKKTRSILKHPQSVKQIQPIGKINHLIHPPPENCLSDYVETHYSAEETIFFARSDLPKRTIQRLKRGIAPVEDTLDLHGFTIEQARSTLFHFIHTCRITNKHYLLVIHGKGRRLTKPSVLKNKTIVWLQQMPPVLAFCSAQPRAGGTGALYILLKKYNPIG